MSTKLGNHELEGRLDLTESMISEGRRSTERWGWAFVLWGVACYVAIAWYNLGGWFDVWGGHELAWPVTMAGATVLTLAIGFGKRKKRQAKTTVSRTISALWGSAVLSMLVLFPALAYVGKLDAHIFVSIVAVVLAVANGASGIILRWRKQLICGVAWWITAATACFGSDFEGKVAFFVAVFFCQILFGICAMVCDSRRRIQEKALETLYKIIG